MNNISHFFVTLEITIFEQQMHSTKFGSVKALSLRTNSCKRRNVATLNPTYQAKNAVYIASSGLCESKRFVWEQS